LFSWYKYLFIDGSKPVSHMLATIALSDADLLGKAPAVLSRLVQRAKALVTPAVGAE
jgi:hypothetical protein